MNCKGQCLPHCSSSKTVIILLGIFLGISIIMNLLLYSRIYALSGSQLIPSSQAKRLIESGQLSQIIDVRTKLEYNSGHYPNSIHLPVNKISLNSVSELNLSSKKGTLVYCNTGQRARVAANKLEKMGFLEVYYIDGHYSSLL